RGDPRRCRSRARMGILDLPAILVGKQRRRLEKVPTDGEGSDRCAIQMSHLAGHPQHVAATLTKRSSQPNEVAPRSVFLASGDACAEMNTAESWIRAELCPKS